MIAVALAAGIIIQCIARAARIPAIILLLGAGVLVGPNGLDWVRPAELGDALFVIVDFAVAVILFEGALNLEIARLRREERVIRRLVTWGAAVTMAGGALAARAWLGWPWPTALLFGSLVIVTGPTVVGPLVRDLRLRTRLQTILEAEGVLIDPIGAIVAVLVLQVILAADPSGAIVHGRDLLLKLVFGAALGAAGGFAIAGLLRMPRFTRGLENVLTLGLVVLVFHVGEAVLGQSGLLAVTIAGLVVGNLGSPVEEDLREFKDQLTVLLIGGIFVLLAADVGLPEVGALGWGGVAVLAALVLVVRPLGCALAATGTDLTLRERIFLGAVAPRGIVAAAVASLIATTLDQAGVAGGAELRAMVFLVIAGTVITAGVLAWPLSQALGLQLPARDRTLILGAQGLGLALGTELKAAGTPVVFVDSDPRRCRDAEERGFAVVYGDGLQERVLRRVPINVVRAAVGATFNDNLNSQFVGLVREMFGVEFGYVAVDSLDAGKAPDHVVRHRGEVAFEGPHDQERWDVRWRQGEIVVDHFEYRPEEAPADATAGEGRPNVVPQPDKRQELFVMLAVRRGERVVPMTLSHKPKAGDIAVVAMHTGSLDAARAELAARQWVPGASAGPDEPNGRGAETSGVAAPAGAEK